LTAKRIPSLWEEFLLIISAKQVSFGGNPLYRWDVLKQQGYKWWIDRIRANLVLYDIIRIDHFRGLAGYWSVPYGEKTAIKGEWIPGPGKEVFLMQLNADWRDIPIIAEDLGVMTDDVEDLRILINLPGMENPAVCI